MDDLISRQAAIEEIRTYITEPNISDDESEIKGFNDGLDLAISVLSVLSSAQERKTGRWKRTYLDHEVMGERPIILYCSECNQCIAYPVNFCPHCGADMRGEHE